MADQPASKAQAAAEKSDAADEAFPINPAPARKPQADKAAIQFPAKASRTARPTTAPSPEPAPPTRIEAEQVKPAQTDPVAPAKSRTAPKPAVTRPVKRGTPAKVASAWKSSSATGSPTVKTAAPAYAAATPASQRKEKRMNQTSEFVDGVQKAAADTQDKARKAFEKSTEMFGEYVEFAKGNVEACIESGKILTAGMQDMGSKLVSEGKAAFETASADVKQLASVKSPGDFIKLQAEILRRNFDSAVSLSSKNGEAVIKLASDSLAPISGRVAVAAEKLKNAA